MTQVRYGARSEDDRRNREAEATSIPVWAKVLTAWYETDPDVVAAVLPRPLEATDEPLVRVTVSTVEIGDRPPFGAGVVAVRARHEGTVGDYALVMPMTTEQAVIGGRETFGEPKKIGEVTLTREGDRVHGAMSRLGVTFVEVQGRVVESLSLPERQTRTAFYFKFLMDPSGKGFDAEPALVYCYRTEDFRSNERVDGDVVLRESHFDPVVDLPVRRLVEVTFSERQSVQRAEIVSRVPAEWLAPFAHQRYDDLSPTGKG
ncbi:MAG TPA: acetoacetate decarboxylase family protein [Acidimicrobiales bacterium]|jgi:acetoacetate decarboxylase|nr:acetoacetate decarboxylase family protein [Acidimicrobiales bacterium]